MYERSAMIVFLLLIVGIDAPHHYDTFEIRHFYEEYYEYRQNKYGYTGVYVYDKSVITCIRDGKPIMKRMYQHYGGLSKQQQYDYLQLFDIIMDINGIKIAEYPNPLYKLDSKTAPVKQGEIYVSYFKHYGTWHVQGVIPRREDWYEKSVADFVVEKHIMGNPWDYLNN